MLFSLLKYYLDTDTALKVCTVALFLYLMVLKIISPGCGVWASLMLFFNNYVFYPCVIIFQQLQYYCFYFCNIGVGVLWTRQVKISFNGTWS